LEFKNPTNCPLDVYCIDSRGKKVWHATVRPGGWYGLNTLVGVRWLMCAANGSVVVDYTTTNICEQCVTPKICSSTTWYLTNNEVLTMEAKAEANRNRIDFVNNTGIKNDYLTVEKANPITGDFEKLEIVNNKSVTNDNEYYSVYDNTPADGDNTYRVKVTYLDGTVKISTPQTVNFKTVTGLRIYPNPAAADVNIDLSKYNGKAVTISFYNSFGNEVMKKIIANSPSTLTLSVSELPVGNYRLRVSSPNAKDAVQSLIIAQ
jgi:Secretion system C-terminal sorting domain